MNTIWKNSDGAILKMPSGAVMGSEKCCCNGTYIPQANLTYAGGYRTIYDSYTGPLIRIERSSDSTYMDVYALANGDIDEAGMASWVGSDTAKVITIYDQVWGNDVTRTYAYAPIIASGGTLKRQNGHPTAYFDGSTFLRRGVSSNIPTNNAARTMVTVAKYDVTTGYSNAFGYGTNSTGQMCILGSNGGLSMINIYNAYLENSGLDTAIHQYAWRFDTAERLDQSELITDNTVQTITTTYNPTTYPSTVIYNFTWGCFADGTNNYKITGYVPECIIFNTSISLTETYANQSAYWGI